MAEIDTSIYKNQEQFNPFERLGQMAGAMQGVNQNKLFQQEFNARKAIGEAYQSAIDPATGQLDSNKLMTLVGNNPDAAFMTGEVANEAQQRQQGQLAIKGQEMENAAKHAKLMSGYFQEMLGDGQKPISQKDVVGVAGRIIADGLSTPQQIAQELSQVNFQNPQATRQWALSHLQRYTSIAGEAERALPQFQPTNVGNQIKMVDMNPMTNQGLGNTDLPLQLPPTTPVINPATNQPGYNVTQPTGGDRFVPSEPRPGVIPAANVAAADSAERSVALSRAAEMVPDNKAKLSQMSGALDSFKSGPLAGNWQSIASPIAQILNIPAENIASKEEFDKIATQLANQQLVSLGGTGTDDKLEAARKANPGSFLSELGNEKIIALLQGNEDAIAAKNQAWEQWREKGNGDDTFGRFTADFNKAYDPRVFQIQYMNPQDQRKMLKDMNESELKKFKKAYATAIDKQWIER